MKTKMKRKNLGVKKIKLTLIPVLLMMLIICGQALSAQATWEGTEVTGTVVSSEFPGQFDWPDPVATISFTDVEFLRVFTNTTTSADFTENMLILTYENTSSWPNVTYPPLTYTFELQGVSISDVSLVNSTFSSEIVSSFTSNSITLEVPLQNTNPGEIFTATFAIVTVQDTTPAEATEDLIEDIEEMGLPEGIENSLVSKLENAIKSMDKGQDNAAVNQLNAFINQVEAQRGKKITEEQADALIAAAESIIDNISNNGS